MENIKQQSRSVPGTVTGTANANRFPGPVDNAAGAEPRRHVTKAGGRER